MSSSPSSDKTRERMRELTTYANGGTNLKEIGLRKENLPGVDAELTDLPLRELHLLPTSAFQ
jgi:hypothetical protein